jgi:hypothetical protein
MSKQQRYWYYVYYPKTDFLMPLGDHPYARPFWWVLKNCLSEHGHKSIADGGWKSFMIDEVLTSEWEKAYRIAANYFNTDPHLVTQNLEHNHA